MKAGHRKQQIAALLERSPSTIGREPRRNRGQRGYRPKQAQAMAEQRARASRTRPRITEDQWQAVATLIRQDWSPEQMADRARLEGTLAISHEAIYPFIYADKRAGGDLWRHLRCQKPYRKRYGSGRERRGHIPGRVGIEQRPPEIERRDRIGHWEVDTVHGRPRPTPAPPLGSRGRLADRRQRQGIRRARPNQRRSRHRLLLRRSVPRRGSVAQTKTPTD
jgi:IS30 family transposase